MKVFITFILILFLSNVHAYDYDYSNSWDVTRNEVIDESFLKFLDFTIGETKIKDVADIFGKSNLNKLNNENYSSVFVCYKSKNNDVSIVFFSGPLGGWEYVTSIGLGEFDFLKKYKCSNLPETYTKESNINGFYFGLGADDVFNLLGNPTYRCENFWAYRYSNKLIRQGLKYDVSSGVEIKFNKKRIKWVRVYKQVSS